MQDRSEILGTLFEEPLSVSKALVVNAGTKFAENEIEQQAGLQLADLLLQVGGEILPKRSDRLLAGGVWQRRHFRHCRHPGTL